jgi:hypothetical protein
MAHRSKDKAFKTGGLMARLFGWVTRPFRWVLPAMQAVLQPKWLIRLSNEAARKFFVFEPPNWAKKLGSVVRPPKKEVSAVHLANPIYWIVWSFDLFWKLFVSRPYRNLGPALPAIVGCLAVVAVAGVIRFQRPQELVNQYRDHLNSASRNQEYDQAVIAAGRLIDLSPDNLDYRFQRAIIEEKRGNVDVANELIERLAFLEKHSQAAQYLLFEKSNLKDLSKWTPEQHARFRMLLDLSKKTGNDKRIQARTMAAVYFNALGARQEAIRQISDIAMESTELSILLASLHLMEGEVSEAKAAAETAERGLRKKLQLNGSDKEVRLNLARMLLILQQERAASKVLMEGFQLTKDDAYRNGAAEALIQMSGRLALVIGENSLLERLQVIREAIEIASDSPLVTDAIIDLVFQVRENKNEEIKTLGRALVSGLSSDSAHFIRGTLALMQDDVESAKLHLEQAVKANPNLPGVLNNLAVAIAAKEGGDLEYALKLSEAAVGQMQEHPYIRETRGQILCKLKRYSDAIPDLEYALRAPELANQVHSSLAEAYEALGQKQLAEQHRELVKKPNS